MNAKTTTILLILFAIAGAALYFTGGGTTSTPNPHPDNSITADHPVLDPDLLGPSLEKLTIDSDGQGENMAVSRSSGRWRVIRPHPFLAKTAAIDEILATIDGLTGYAIDAPSIPKNVPKIDIVSGGQTLSIILADRLGAGRAKLYLRSNASMAGYNVTDDLHDLIDQIDLSLCYGDQLDPPLMPEVGRIEITTPESTSVLTQRDGKWRIGASATSERALVQSMPDHPGISELFKLISVIKLNQHHPYDSKDDLAKFGLGKPLITARFSGIDEDPSNPNAGMLIGIGVPADPTDQKRFISYGPADAPMPAVFTTDTSLALAFGQDATAFRDPRFVATPASLVQSITIEHTQAPKQFIWLKADGSATLDMPQVAPLTLRPEHTALLTHALTQTRPTGYIQPTDQRLKEIAHVEVSEKLSNKVEKFTIFADPDADKAHATVLVRRGNEPVLLRVDQAAVETLLNPLHAPE